MTLSTSTYDGGLRCSAVHGPSGITIHTDAPVDNQGRGEAFSPTDLVAAALATCILTIMGITADRDGFAIEGSSAKVEKRMTSSGVRRIAELEVWVTLPAALNDDQREKLRRAGEACPVKRSLEGSVPMQIHWN
jgi:putative redox protein